MRPGPSGRGAGISTASRRLMLPIDEPELDAGLIGSRYRVLVDRLRSVAEAAGRDPDAVRVVAVTKGFRAEVVLAAHSAGLSRFGENRMQEAIPKLEAVPDAEWHLVGHLQANKARRAAGAFAMIHSVDSVDLLHRLERICIEEGLAPRLLLQVNVTGEATKAGFELEGMTGEIARRGELRRAIDDMRAASVVGLMTIAPAGGRAAEARATFARLRTLRDELEQAVGRPLPELSMGMTADADAAVAEGATLVRVGTAIFGSRPA
jgi:pyridoxal phosphate enzyme (YggS family)